MKKPKINVLLNASGVKFRLNWIDDKKLKIRSKVLDPIWVLYLLSKLFSNEIAKSLKYSNFTMEIKLNPEENSGIKLEKIFCPNEPWMFSFLYYIAINEQCQDVIEKFKSSKSYNMPIGAADWKKAFKKNIYSKYPYESNLPFGTRALNSLLKQWRNKVFSGLKKELKLEQFVSKPYYIPKGFGEMVRPLLREGGEYQEDLFTTGEAVSKDQLKSRLEPLIFAPDLVKLIAKLKVTTLISLRTEKNELVLSFIDTLGSYFNLQPEKLIPLIENPGVPKMIRPMEEKNYYNQRGVGEIVGKLDPERGMLVFITATDGDRVHGNKDNAGDRQRFFIDIDDVLPYYLVIKKQFEEKIIFEREWLRVQSEANDIIDIY